MSKVANKQFINQIDGPEYIMNNKKKNRMIVMPTDHHGVDPQDKINNT